MYRKSSGITSTFFLLAFLLLLAGAGILEVINTALMLIVGAIYILLAAGCIYLLKMIIGITTKYKNEKNKNK